MKFALTGRREKRDIKADRREMKNAKNKIGLRKVRPLTDPLKRAPGSFESNFK